MELSWGGILGSGVAAAISRGKDRWWAIPTKESLVAQWQFVRLMGVDMTNYIPDKYFIPNL